MKIIKRKYIEYFALFTIVATNAYLRLFQITHLFKWIYDYDEGSYSLGARFITQGVLPYRDYTLVHPPLYNLALAGIYETFGYNFFYGRYFSVFLSVLCIIMAYLSVKKLSNSLAGIIAALLFAVFPGFTLLWYRAVQEPLGIFLVLLAFYLATDFIKDKKTTGKILFSGICLGLAVATKYTFIPAVLGFGIGILIFNGIIKRGIWLLTAGGIIGFLLPAGYFLIKYPGEFYFQTFAAQIGFRAGNVIQNILARFTQLPERVPTLTQIPSGVMDSTICTLLFIVSFLVIAILLFRRNFGRVSLFLIITLMITMPLCLLFNPFGEMKYFASNYIFMLLALALFIPPVNVEQYVKQMDIRAIWRLSPFFGVLGVALFFLLGTLLLKANYNFAAPGLTYEESNYQDSIAYLENAGECQIFSLDPIIPALSNRIIPSEDFDTFGMLFVTKENPADIIQKHLDNGARYIVTDSFILFTVKDERVGQMVEAIKAKCTLKKVISYKDVPVFDVMIYSYP